MISEIIESNPYKIVLSNPNNKTDNSYKKIVINKKQMGVGIVYQAECYTETQVFHNNMKESELETFIDENFGDNFKQMNTWALEWEYDAKISKKGKLMTNKRRVKGKVIEIGGNNRKKNYILEEGMDIPVFRELGIFTKDGKVVHSMYDKFKQINRFTELVDDILKDYKKDEIHIIDFGCGKSYLTFVLYYYLVEIKGLKVQITGLDLKKTVIDKCNTLAKQFGYEGLKFELGDINGYKCDFEVDMVVTLHACDTATDYALYNAINWNATYIMSVPCCQHEVNKQIKSHNLSAVTKYGIIKERTAALFTDAIRGCVLEYAGYKTDLLEFIDIEHSPKNILIRAVKKHVSDDKKQMAAKEAKSLCDEFGFEQTLAKLILR